MAQPLKESKEDLIEDNDENKWTKFKEVSHQNCSSEELFNALQLYGQALFMDIRAKKEYKQNHIRSFINVPQKCKTKYAIKHIKKRLSYMYKNLTIDIYCYSNKDSIEKNNKWYKYIQELLHKEFHEYKFQSFNILSVDYNAFSNRFPMLITKQIPKQYEIFTRYPNIIISNKLYLGDRDHATDSNVIKDIGITHIVNMTTEVECAFRYDEELSHIKYLQCKILDDAYTDIDQLFEKCVNFIDKAFNENDTNKCLVHCVAGVSRSSTIIIAYLMKMKKMKYDDALDYTIKRRRIVNPNPGFRRQLKSWEERGYKALELDDDW
eukprot:413415_1